MLLMTYGVVDCSVNDRHIVLPIRMKLVQELLALVVRKSDGIVLPVPVSIHIVDVVPDVLKRDVEVAEVVNNILHFSPVRVAPTALMEAKDIVLLHRWHPDDTLLVLLGYRLLIGTSQEVEVNAAADRSPGDVLSS